MSQLQMLLKRRFSLSKAEVHTFPSVPKQFKLEFSQIRCSYLPFDKAQLPPSFCFSQSDDLRISAEVVQFARNYVTRQVQQLNSTG